jgi:hypothetical protein
VGRLYQPNLLIREPREKRDAVLRGLHTASGAQEVILPSSPEKVDPIRNLKRTGSQTSLKVPALWKRKIDFKPYLASLKVALDTLHDASIDVNLPVVTEMAVSLSFICSFKVVFSSYELYLRLPRRLYILIQ